MRPRGATVPNPPLQYLSSFGTALTLVRVLLALDWKEFIILSADLSLARVNGSIPSNSIHHVMGQKGTGLLQNTKYWNRKKDVRKKIKDINNKHCELRKEGGHIQWAPPSETSGTIGTQGVGTYVIIAVASNVELRAYRSFQYTNLSCPMWDKSIWQPTPFNWSLPLSYLSFVPSFLFSAREPSDPLISQFRKNPNTCFRNICNHQIKCINIMC